MSAAGIVDTIEDLLAYVCSKFKMAMADYINIESIDDDPAQLSLPNCANLAVQLQAEC
jgi:hypothetical protein